MSLLWATLLRAIRFYFRFWICDFRSRRYEDRKPAIAIRKLLASLWTFRTVLRTGLISIRNTGCVERSADNVVTHTRKILHAASADEHDRVLLQVVTDTRNVGCDLNLVSQAYTCDLTKSRVRLFRGRGVNACANTALLRVRLQSRARRFVFDSLASFAN